MIQKPEIDLNDLDKKIEVIKQRKDIIEDLNKSATDEIEALSFLYARKLYKKHIDKFNWATTTIKLVDDLLKKYKLKMIDFKDTTAEKVLPLEALEELEKYLAAYKLVNKNEPIIKLIVEDERKSKEYKRADPILLAGSPFGKWYFFLGAWDKEIEYVEELVYQGK